LTNLAQLTAHWLTPKVLAKPTHHSPARHPDVHFPAIQAFNHLLNEAFNGKGVKCLDKVGFAIPPYTAK